MRINKQPILLPIAEVYSCHSNVFIVSLIVTLARYQRQRNDLCTQVQPSETRFTQIEASDFRK